MGEVYHPTLEVQQKRVAKDPDNDPSSVNSGVPHCQDSFCSKLRETAVKGIEAHLSFTILTAVLTAKPTIISGN